MIGLMLVRPLIDDGGAVLFDLELDLRNGRRC